MICWLRGLTIRHPSGRIDEFNLEDRKLVFHSEAEKAEWIRQFKSKIEIEYEPVDERKMMIKKVVNMAKASKEVQKEYGRRNLQKAN